MLGWMCEENLWEFLSDVMVVREFLNFFKGVKYYFRKNKYVLNVNRYNLKIIIKKMYLTN